MKINIEVVTEEIVVLNLMKKINKLYKGVIGRRIIIYIDKKQYSKMQFKSK